MRKVHNENLSWEVPDKTNGELPKQKHNFQLDLLSALKNEQQLLLEKMKKAMDEDNVGTYKNLVTALREITYLVQNEENKIKYEKAYVEVNIDSVCVYFKGEKALIKVITDSNVVPTKVKEVLSYNKQIPICIDIRGVGVVVYDILKAEGYNVISSKNSIIKIN